MGRKEAMSWDDECLGSGCECGCHSSDKGDMSGLGLSKGDQHEVMGTPGCSQGSDKALRCEWANADGSRCGNGSTDACAAFYFILGGIRMMACEEHWRLLNTLKQLRSDGTRKVMGLSETGRMMWERNYWLAQGRAEGQVEGQVEGLMKGREVRGDG